MYEIYMHNKNTDNKIRITVFDNRITAEEFVHAKNTNPIFVYYIHEKKVK